jgi:hypothetical protein
MKQATTDHFAIIGLRFTAPVMIHVAGPLEIPSHQMWCDQKCCLCGLPLIMLMDDFDRDKLFQPGEYVSQDARDRLRRIAREDIPPLTRMCR